MATGGGEREKKEACRDFQRGACTRGQSCPYVHKVKKSHDVQLCRDYTIRGHCPRKGTCPYRHPKASRSQSSSSSSGRSQSSATFRPGSSTPPSLYCHDYLMGTCDRGADCPHLHANNRVEVCRDYIRGECVRGSSCPFHHPHTIVGEGQELCREFQREGGCSRNPCSFVHLPWSVEICRDFERGECRRGVRCPFHHPGASVSTIDEASLGAKRKRSTDTGSSGDSEIRRLREELRILREENVALRLENNAFRSENQSLRAGY